MIILYAISLDMFSVLFGGVVALLPVFAEDILRVGPEGLGMLRAAPAIGALLTVLVCAYHPPLMKPWRNLLLAVAGFGLATLVFAMSKIFRSEEHTSELQSLMRISYAVFCLKKKKKKIVTYILILS